jgi:ATP-dependent helicase/nuclease subunit B
LIRLPQDVAEAVERGDTLVVPSRQRSEAVRLAYAAGALERQATVWRSPDVLPIEAWKTREIERRAAAGEWLPRLITPAEEWLLWRQATAQLTRDLDLVAPGPLADALRRASRLAQEFRIDLERLHSAAGGETRLLLSAFQSVSDRLRALGADTAAHVGQQVPCLGGGRHVVFAGFALVTPGLRRLMENRERQGCASVVRAVPAASGQTRVVHANDSTDELERIAEWCRQRVESAPGARLMVQLPGAPEARERLVTLIRQNIDARSAVLGDLVRAESDGLATIEGGLPLSRAPIVAHALQALQWLDAGSEFEEFSAWLCAPHWSLRDADRARIDLWLRDRVSLEIEPRTLLRALEGMPPRSASVARELALQVSAALKELPSGPLSPRQWSERFDAALNALQWPGARALDSNEEQTRARFTELLDDFGQLAAVAGTISRKDAVQWLRELATRTAFRPASGDALVTVTPQLIDPIARYDAIWVAGLHADAWPVPAQPDPFLPVSLQLDAGIPAATSDGRAAEARALLAAWQSSTPDLVLSTPLRAEDVQLSPSPFLAAFPPAETPAATGESRSIWLPLRVRREGLTESVDDSAGVPWVLSQPLPSGTRSVELQNLCPFRAYAEMRLGSSDLDVPEPGVPPDVRGMLLHAALERLWRELRDSSALASQGSASLDALIAGCVEGAANEIMGRVSEGGRTSAQQRECRRAVRLIRALCDLERRRPPFRVREAELKRTLHLAGALLNVRIDRLDELSAGGLAILDYKSGRPTPGDWYSERPSHPQLLAYLASVGNEAVAMATISVTAREVRFDGVALDSTLLPKVRGVELLPPEQGAQQGPASDLGAQRAASWAHWQREWRARVEGLAADFVAGRAAVDPRPKACEWCQVVGICRISDASASAVEENIDE